LGEPKFINSELLFDLNALPPIFKFRDEEQKKLNAFVFNSAVEGRKAFNMAVFGESGTGKTLVVKSLMKKMDQNTYYINTGESTNILLCLSAFYFSLTGRKLETRSKSELVEKILTALYEKHGQNIPVVLILDEFDRYLNSRFGSDAILYPLLRPNTNDNRPHFWLSILLIANNMNMLEKFTAPISSSFGNSWVLFQKYTEQQLETILKERVTLSLSPAYRPDISLLQKIAKHEAENGKGDARRALEILGQAVMNSKSKITETDVDCAIKEVEKKTLLSKIKQLNTHDIVLLLAAIGLYKKNGGSFSPQVFQYYRRILESVNYNYILGQKQTHRLMFELEKKNFILLSKRYDLAGQPLFLMPKGDLDSLQKILLQEAIAREGLNSPDLEEIVLNVPDAGLPAPTPQTILELEDEIE